MTYMGDTISSRAGGVAIVDGTDELTAFLSPDCAAAVWTREPAPRMQSWVGALPPDCLPRARIILQPTAVEQALRQLCVNAGTPECAEREMLIDDATALAQMFARLVDARYLRIRLDVVTTNACRKFHTDAVTARLVCTYRGTGTQYGLTDDGADPQRVFTVPTGSPILLRGTLWPCAPSSRVVHRSPPIEGTGETRLVLVIDPVFDLEDEA